MTSEVVLVNLHEHSIEKFSSDKFHSFKVQSNFRYYISGKQGTTDSYRRMYFEKMHIAYTNGNLKMHRLERRKDSRKRLQRAEQAANLSAVSRLHGTSEKMGAKVGCPDSAEANARSYICVSQFRTRKIYTQTEVNTPARNVSWTCFLAFCIKTIEGSGNFISKG